MLFLGIVSWKGASCFNGGGGGVVFQIEGGFIFKWGGAPHGWSISFDGGVFKKKCRMGGVPPMPPNYGKPCPLPGVGLKASWK